MVIAKWIENGITSEQISSDINAVKMANNSTNINLNKTDNINKTITEWKSNHLPTVDETALGCSKIILICQSNSHPFQTRTITLEENSVVKVGRSIARNRVAENNAIFDCKVLSRNHAVLWFSEGKFYVKDTKSSNGTFINDRRVSQSEPEELSSGDIVKFGVDVIENTRKEIHGCIIACVKLYLPDGKECISTINSELTDIGSGSITIDELHRLHHYVQETVQRERMLQNKLHDIQLILDLTRKNTTSCWQAMVDEDRLLNRIDVLENKLQLYQKKFPNDRLNDDIVKFQEDKFVYENLAKEALHKVYEERMEALQKLSTIERALCSSEDECSILRDQLLRSQLNVQEMNSRLERVEEEYSLHRQNVIENEKENLNNDIEIQLRNKEKECENYKTYINEILHDRNDLKKQLEDFSKCGKSDDREILPKLKTEPKGTITKWLENSDLNQKEESAAIIRAICEESDTDVNDDENSLIDENCIQLREKLEYLQNTLNDLNNLKSDENPVDREVMNDGNQNFEIDAKNNVALKENIRKLSDICKEVCSYLTLVKEMRIEKQIKSDELLEKVYTMEMEINKYEKELKIRPTLQVFEEKIDENESLREQLIKTDKRVENLMEEIDTLKNRYNILHEKKEQQPEEQQEITMTTTTTQIHNNEKSEEIIDATTREMQLDMETVNNLQNCHEEELIIYKEKYDDILSDNRKLKDEIQLLQTKMNQLNNTNIIKFSTIFAIFVAVFCYIILRYF